MSNESFEKRDQDFMEKLKTEREKGVSPEILRGFSASVEAKIRQKEVKKCNRPLGARLMAPVLVPVFAVILLASVVVFKNPSFHMPGPEPTMAMMLTSTADLSDEIAALEELGVWGDEDSELLDISGLEAMPEEPNPAE